MDLSVLPPELIYEIIMYMLYNDLYDNFIQGSKTLLLMYNQNIHQPIKLYIPTSSLSLCAANTREKINNIIDEYEETIRHHKASLDLLYQKQYNLDAIIVRLRERAQIPWYNIGLRMLLKYIHELSTNNNPKKNIKIRIDYTNNPELAIFFPTNTRQDKYIDFYVSETDIKYVINFEYNKKFIETDGRHVNKFFKLLSLLEPKSTKFIFEYNKTYTLKWLNITILISD